MEDGGEYRPLDGGRPARRGKSSWGFGSKRHTQDVAPAAVVDGDVTPPPAVDKRWAALSFTNRRYRPPPPRSAPTLMAPTSSSMPTISVGGASAAVANETLPNGGCLPVLAQEENGALHYDRVEAPSRQPPSATMLEQHERSVLLQRPFRVHQRDQVQTFDFPIVSKTRDRQDVSYAFINHWQPLIVHSSTLELIVEHNGNEQYYGNPVEFASLISSVMLFNRSMEVLQAAAWSTVDGTFTPFEYLESVYNARCQTVRFALDENARWTTRVTLPLMLFDGARHNLYPIKPSDGLAVAVQWSPKCRSEDLLRIEAAWISLSGWEGELSFKLQPSLVLPIQACWLLTDVHRYSQMSSADHQCAEWKLSGAQYCQENGALTLESLFICFEPTWLVQDIKIEGYNQAKSTEFGTPTASLLFERGANFEKLQITITVVANVGATTTATSLHGGHDDVGSKRTQQHTAIMMPDILPELPSCPLVVGTCHRSLVVAADASRASKFVV